MAVKKNSYEKFKEEQLKDIEIRQAYEEEKLQARIAMIIAKERGKQHLTQQELAKKAHMKQSVVSRLESLDYPNCTIKTIQRMGQALGKDVKINFV